MLTGLSARFDGKTALVTGGAGGIGAAIARRFISEGGNIVVADIDGPRAESFASALGPRALAIQTDVTDARSVEHMVSTALDHFEALDILFNNAGVIRYGSLLKQDETAFDQVMAVNIKGTFLVAQEVARYMARPKRGVIVNTASVMSDLAVHGTLAYCASKGAVYQMTKVMALELAHYNIRVNCIGPGIVDTPMMAKSLADKHLMAPLLERWAIKRPAQADEAAAVALFLASDDASYITGEIIYADGGWRIG